MRRSTSSASAICGTALGWTNEVTSIQPNPAAESRSTKWTLSSVEMRAFSFCSPSRGPTSTTRTSAVMTSTVLSVPPSRCGRLSRGPEREQLRAARDLLADLDMDVGNDARVRRFDDMLHLHRLERDQRLVLADLLTLHDGDFDHTA